jgi:hypothetical protein
MRFVEIQGNLLAPISNEEEIVLEKVSSTVDPYPKSKLDEREQELARQLVTRGILDRIRVDNCVCFVHNEPSDVWRDR